MWQQRIVHFFRASRCSYRRDRSSCRGAGPAGLLQTTQHTVGFAGTQHMLVQQRNRHAEAAATASGPLFSSRCSICLKQVFQCQLSHWYVLCCHFFLCKHSSFTYMHVFHCSCTAMQALLPRQAPPTRTSRTAGHAAATARQTSCCAASTAPRCTTCTAWTRH